MIIIIFEKSYNTKTYLFLAICAIELVDKHKNKFLQQSYEYAIIIKLKLEFNYHLILFLFHLYCDYYIIIYH